MGNRSGNANNTIISIAHWDRSINSEPTFPLFIHCRLWSQLNHAPDCCHSWSGGFSRSTVARPESSRPWQDLFFSHIEQQSHSFVRCGRLAGLAASRVTGSIWTGRSLCSTGDGGNRSRGARQGDRGWVDLFLCNSLFFFKLMMICFWLFGQFKKNNQLYNSRAPIG